MEVGCDTLQQERGAEEVRTEDGEQGRYGAFVHLKGGGAGDTFRKCGAGVKDGHSFLHKHVDCW